jgi:double-stranded uracil-DNA glycosylase
MIHSIAPLYNQTSKVLILGSFPSVKSRESGFFYGNPQNRFWDVLSALLDCNKPQSIELKKEMLLNHHVALWDVIQSCDIKGSSDASIEHVLPNDILSIIESSQITKIYANGNKAFQFYNTYVYPQTKLSIILLPSTSPANAKMSLEKLIEAWARVL